MGEDKTALGRARCQRCEGCGLIADDAVGLAWVHWEALHLDRSGAVLFGVVQPRDCPDCAGTGTVEISPDPTASPPQPTRATRERERARRRRARGAIGDAPDQVDAALLGTTVEATARELRRAYRQAMRKTHPDRGGEPEAFQAVVLAYERMCRRRRWSLM